MEQLGLVDGKKFAEWPVWEGSGLPVRGNCDLANPRQAFLWMFTAMPGVQGAPLMLTTEYWEMQSWRMWVLGARPVADPELKYQPPANMVANQWVAAGKWVGVDEPDLPQKTLSDVVDGLGQGDRAELKDIVLERMGLNAATPDAPPGHLRVDELAARLNLPVSDLVSALAGFGMSVQPDSYVGRETAERIVVHLGLADAFDPADHTVVQVLGHLHSADPAEVRRVLSVERAGKSRNGILKRFEEI